MQKYISVLIICLIPFFAALAHDIYLFIEVNKMENPFSIAAIGFVWATYSSESLTAFLNGLENAKALEIVNQILQYPASSFFLIAGIGLFIAMSLQYLFLRLVFGKIGGPGYSKESKMSKRFKDKKFHYNRK